MKIKCIKDINIFLITLIILLQIHTVVYASMDAEQIKTLFDMYENNLGDINDLKKVIDQMYSDVNGATKVDDQLKATLKKDVQDLNTVSGIDANVVTLLSTQLNTEIDNLTDDNLGEMKEEVSTIKQWVDNKSASNSNTNNNNNSSNNNNSTNAGATSNTTNITSTTNTTTNTISTPTTTTNSTVKTTNTSRTTDKTTEKTGIPRAGTEDKIGAIIAVSIIVMIVLAIKNKNLKEIK